MRVTNWIPGSNSRLGHGAKDDGVVPWVHGHPEALRGLAPDQVHGQLGAFRRGARRQHRRRHAEQSAQTDNSFL